MARATSPNDSKKFLVWRSPGSASESTPKQPVVAGPADHAVHHRLADSHLPGTGKGVQVGDDAEDSPVVEGLRPDHAVAHRGAVDLADHDRTGGIVEVVGERGSRRQRPSGLAPPDVAASVRGQLVDGGGGQVPEDVEVGERPGASRDLHAVSPSGAA